jgi:2'-5' RNA ligase
VRLFIAFDLDDGARAALGDEQARLARLVPRDSAPRWTDAGHLHLTLVFLGEVTDGVAAALVSVCSAPLGAPAFDLSLKGLGVFPPKGAPRILWIGVDAGRDAAGAVQRLVVERVEAAGVELERRPFHPHLTLGRWRTSRPSDARRALGADSGKTIARVRIDHATLYHSRVGSAGSTYTPLARATLT